jgi:hypothetical protein
LRLLYGVVEECGWDTRRNGVYVLLLELLDIFAWFFGGFCPDERCFKVRKYRYRSYVLLEIRFECWEECTVLRV